MDMELDWIDMEFFLILVLELVEVVIIFGVDMILSTKIDSTKKDTLILRKGPTQGLGHCLQKKCIKLLLLKIIKKSL